MAQVILILFRGNYEIHQDYIYNDFVVDFGFFM